MKVILNSDIGEIDLNIIQQLVSQKDVVKKSNLFIRQIANLNPDDFPTSEKVKSCNEWFSRLVIPTVEPPFEFKIGIKVFKSCYLEVQEKKYSNPLGMQLAFLIEAANVDLDQDLFKGIDNIAALFYREDWAKDFDAQEYFNNAKLFERSKLKYSLYGLTKYNELIVTLKNTFPILYQESGNEEPKTDRS